MGRTELNKYVFSLVGLSAVVLIGLFAVVMGMQEYLSSARKTVAFSPTVAPSGAPHSLEGPKRFPHAVVADWGTLPALPTFDPPTRTTLYALKQQFSTQEFANLAQHFISVNGNRVSEKQNSISVVTDKDDIGMFYMFKPTGSFMYKAKKGVELPAQGGSDPENVGEFMRDIWNDTTLQVTGSYDKRSTPGVRFYEVHRDWDKLGLPIINLMGTFNIPDEQKVGKLSLLKPSVTAADADIVGTDNGTDGRARANDFNTATVGVEGGRIVSVVSNIRPLNRQGTREHGMITYDEAVAKLKLNNYLYLLTSPAGEGSANSDLLYPDNSVSLKDVRVTEAVAAYLEELPNKAQTQLYPYYVFRGQAMSGTDYRINFIAAVPAVANTVLGASTGKQVGLLALKNGFNQSQQQGTLEFVDPTDAPIPALSQPPAYTPAAAATGVPVQQQLEALVCDPPPSPSDLMPARTDLYGYTYGQWIRPTRDDRQPDWYVVTGAGWDLVALHNAMLSVFSDLEAAGDTERVRDMTRTIQEFESAPVGCPVRISGSSPTVFIYGEHGMQFMARSGAKISYSDPPAKGGSWSGRITQEGLEIDSENIGHLYYEYTGVKFSRPEEGWVVAKHNLKDLVGRISREAKLNHAEVERLGHELANAAQQTKKDRLFIGIIDVGQVNTLLPLELNPTMSVARLHFYVGGAPPFHLGGAPTLAPVIRKPNMAVEIGAFAE